MSLKNFSVSCDWPGCTSSGTVVISGDAEHWNGWKTLGNAFVGPHLCKDHVGKTHDDLRKVQQRLREARSVADEIVKKVFPDGPALAGAKLAFDVAFPGAEEAWKRCVAEEKERSKK